MIIAEGNIIKAISGNPLSTRQIAKRLGVPQEDGKRMWELSGAIDRLTEHKKLETAIDRNAPRNIEARAGVDTYKHYLIQEASDLEKRGILSPEKKTVPGKTLKEYKKEFGIHWYLKR